MIAHEPRPKRFTRKEYYAMGEMGWFADRRVELIAGEIIEMSPQNSSHAWFVNKVAAMLQDLLPPGLILRNQGPLYLGLRTEPEPDIAICKGSWDDVEPDNHPNWAALIIEVSLSTLNFDRIKKGSLYAKSGIPEYWIINIGSKCLEVYRDPVKARGQAFGYKYASSQIYQKGNTVEALCLPGKKIAVAEMLPK